MLGDGNPLLIRFVLRVAECLLNLCRCDEAAHALHALEGLAASTKAKRCRTVQAAAALLARCHMCASCPATLPVILLPVRCG